MEKTELSTAAREARTAYKKRWRENNSERIAAYNREYHSRPENKGKRAEYQKNYWERVAAESAEVLNDKNGNP